MRCRFSGRFSWGRQAHLQIYLDKSCKKWLWCGSLCLSTGSKPASSLLWEHLELSLENKAAVPAAGWHLDAQGGSWILCFLCLLGRINLSCYGRLRWVAPQSLRVPTAAPCLPSLVPNSVPAQWQPVPGPLMLWLWLPPSCFTNENKPKGWLGT